MSLSYPYSKLEGKWLPLPFTTFTEQPVLWHLSERCYSLIQWIQSKWFHHTSPKHCDPFLALLQNTVYSFFLPESLLLLLIRKSSLTAKPIFITQTPGRERVQNSLEAAACAPLGEAEFTDRTVHTFRCASDVPHCCRNGYTRQQPLASSTVGWSDKTGDGDAWCTGMKGIPQNRHSWASNPARVRGQSLDRVQWACSPRGGTLGSPFRTAAVVRDTGGGCRRLKDCLQDGNKKLLLDSLGIKDGWQRPTPKEWTLKKIRSLLPTG